MGCFGNVDYHVYAYCYILRCPVIYECRIKRKENKGQVKNGI